MLGIAGFASSQAISLYRYYRQLTTPGGQAVQYTADERALLQRLNVVVPGLSQTALGAIPNALLNASLDGDRGMVRSDGAAGSVLRPGEQIVVTGHSLGGHLALLFDRLFPGIAQQVYTFNAPGISFWGDALLSAAGVASNDPSHIVNVKSAYGVELSSAFGRRPGFTYEVFNEFGGPLQNHSVVALADSLALYEVFGKLSPALANRIDEVSSILAAASAKPAESLEATLDMLRRTLMGGNDTPTPIAVDTGDQAQRNEYYTRLYELRDTMADRDWRISSLAGLSASALRNRAGEELSVRYALQELMPFAAAGATFDESLRNLSSNWLIARSDFLSRLLEARSNDLPFGRSADDRNLLFVDVDRDVRLSVLNSTQAITARSFIGSDEAMSNYLDGLAYQEKTVFGSDDASVVETLEGSPGADTLFANAGDDVLIGLGGDDVLNGGAGDDNLVGGDGGDTLAGDAGADILEGGAGYDTYIADASDTILDSDGAGEVWLAGEFLEGGNRRADGRYISSDGLHVYDFSADLGARGTLTVDGRLTIKEFADGDLGIDLTRAPRTHAAADFTYYGDRLGSSAVPDAYGNSVSDIPGPDTGDMFIGRPGNTAFITGGDRDFVADQFDGDDTIQLGDGDDIGFGGEGNDWLEGGTGHDILLGGRGADVLFAEAPDSDIDTPIAPQLGDIFPINELSGGDGADAIFGSREADYIEGGAGADVVVAGAGDDTIYGDGWYLSYQVGEYYDAYPQTFPAGTFPQDVLGVATDVLGGRLYHGPVPLINLPAFPGNSAAQPYFDSADAGDDEIHAGAGNDFVFAGGGDDLVFGDSGHDRLEGGTGNDELHGGDGNDLLYGQDGDDVLFGGTGSDTLYGGPGSDRFDGGADGDRYFVGDGDTYVVRIGSGFDTVTADGAFPATGTIEFGAGISPEDVKVYAVEGSGSWTAFLTGSALDFAGEFSKWSGVGARFADGTEWDHDAIGARGRETLALLLSGSTAHYGSDGPDHLSGSPASETLSGGAGDDTYNFGKYGGRDTVQDASGTDTVVLNGVRSDEVSVFASGSDYLLRFEGSEVRLANQSLAGPGIESLQFTGDGVSWARADLESHATPLAQPNLLGVQAAVPGQAFSYALPGDTFADAYVLGTPAYDAVTVEGGPLPAWLSFDREHAVLSGTPAASDSGVSGVLIALRDDDQVAAVAPLVIAVGTTDAGSPPAGDSPPLVETPPVETLPPQPMETAAVAAPAAASLAMPPAPAAAASDFLAPSAASRTVAQSESTPLVLGDPPPSAFTPVVPVGHIDDPIYDRIVERLFAPATFHAPVFMERYEEAMREFRRRQEDTGPSEPDAPPPTDEEMAIQNAALHAWLDGDLRRSAAASHVESRDFGGMEPRLLASGGGLENLLGVASDAFARPGLPALRQIQAQPGLREGLANLSG